MTARIAVVVLAALAGCRGATHDDATRHDGTPPLPTCPASDAFFSMSPVALSSVGSLTPLGNLNPPGHVFPTEHQYLYLQTAEGGGGTLPVDVVAPGRLFLLEVDSSEHLTAGFADYDLWLSPCEGVLLKLGHVATLDPALAATLGAAAVGDCQTYSTGGEDYRYCRRSVRLELPVGARIGTAGGNPGQYALDLGVQDLRKPAATFANPAGYDGFLHSRCVLDYFDDASRAALYGKVGRSAEPRCGTHAQDVAGTAQGNWRRAGAPTFPEDPHLALVHDMIEPQAVALSIGTSLGVDPAAWWIMPASASGRANRDPHDVTADGGTWCWDAAGMRLVVAMPTATTLRAQIDAGVACGEGPWTLGAGATEFAR
jgi:hypothetical protein